MELHSGTTLIFCKGARGTLHSSISANLIAYREGVTTGGKSVQLFARQCRGFLPRRSVEWYARVARPCEKRRDSSHTGPQFIWAFRDGDPRCAACVRHADQYRISVRRLQLRRDMRAQLYRTVRGRAYSDLKNGCNILRNFRLTSLTHRG